MFNKEEQRQRAAAFSAKQLAAGKVEPTFAPIAPKSLSSFSKMPEPMVSAGGWPFSARPVSNFSDASLPAKMPAPGMSSLEISAAYAALSAKEKEKATKQALTMAAILGPHVKSKPVAAFLVEAARKKKLPYDRVPFTNEFGQVIQPDSPVVYAASGFNHSTKIRKGVYLGSKSVNGRVTSVSVISDKGDRTTLPSKRIYQTV